MVSLGTAFIIPCPSIDNYIILPPIMNESYPVATPLDSNEQIRAQHEAKGQC